MGKSVQGSKDQSAVANTSFFKVMLADNFSDVMFLPPRFAQTISNLVEQKIQLQDVCGLRWTVTLSEYKGSLAFHMGWHAFSVQHHLKIGDFLLFRYVAPSLFVVEIYGRSGCLKIPRLDDIEFGRKRRVDEKSCDKSKHLRKTGSDAVNGRCSNTYWVSGSNIEINGSPPMPVDKTSNADTGNSIELFSKTNCIEEQFCMINRDFEVKQCELRDSLLDLANFEIRPSGVSGTGKNVLENKRSHGCNALISNSEGESGMVVDVPVAKEMQSCQLIPEVVKSEILQKNNNVGKMDTITRVEKEDSEKQNASKKEQCSETCSGKDQILKSHKQHAPARESGQSLEEKFAGGLFSGLQIPVNPAINSSGRGLKTVKQEKVEMREEEAGKILETVKQEREEMREEAIVHGETLGKQWIMELNENTYPAVEFHNHDANVMVKPEPVDLNDDIPAVAVKIPFSQATYLELPARLLPVPSRAKNRPERKVVIFLRDPKSRVWPVLYQERFGLKVLTSGWDAFRKASNIVPGDECVFRVEDDSECVFGVSVLCK